MKLRAKAYLRIAAEDWRKKYDWAAGTFHDGLAEVTVNRKSGLVDETGKEVVPPIYDSIGGFQYGLAEVRLDGKYGFIDKTGEVVIPAKYSRVYRFNNGLAKVELGDKKGWVTREGKELLIPEDKYIQIKNLIELEKITEEELINWINERAV